MDGYAHFLQNPLEVKISFEADLLRLTLLVLSGDDFALDWSEKTCLAKKDLPGQIFFHFPALSSQTSRPVIGVQ